MTLSDGSFKSCEDEQTNILGIPAIRDWVFLFRSAGAVGGTMVDPGEIDKDRFLYPRNRYHGQVKPENLVFDANLQEFAQRVSYICNLETRGKLPPEDAYEQVKTLWEQLTRSKKELGIGENPFQKEEENE